MASKRNAKFLDAQNFIYELRQKWYQTEEQMEKHNAENGKDTTYSGLRPGSRVSWIQFDIMRKAGTKNASAWPLAISGWQI